MKESIEALFRILILVTEFIMKDMFMYRNCRWLRNKLYQRFFYQ